MGKLVPKRVISNQKKLYEWIRQNAYTERPEGDFVAIRIHHIKQKSVVGDEVERIDIPGKDDRHETWDKDLASHIMTNLHDEASQLGGLQTYACYSVFSAAPEDTVNRCLVKVEGHDDSDDDEILSEMPNSTGLAQQAMRHQEANARIMTGSVVQMQSAMAQQMARVMDMNEMLMKNQQAMVKDMTEMWMEKRQLILDTQLENIKAHGAQEGLSMLKQIAPVLINQAIGKDLLPVDKKAGVTSMAKSFYGSLTQEQMEALNKVLRQDQLITFMTMGETLVDDGEDDNKKE